MDSVMRLRGRLASGLIAAAVLTLLTGVQPLAVLGHAELVNSTPADGAELASPPQEIRLVFSEAPRLDSLTVRLFDRRGTEMALGGPSVGPYPTTILVPVPGELAPGPYTVVWSVVSVEDAHPAAQEFVFGVREPPGAPSVTADALAGMGNGPLVPLAALLALIGLTLMVGAAFQAAVLRLDGLRVLALAAAGAGLMLASVATTVAAAPRAAATISDGSSGLFAGADPADVARIALIGGFVAGVTAAAQLNSEAGRRRIWLFALGAGIALTWLYAAKSHAAGVGILPWVGIAWGAIDVAIADPGRYAGFSAVFEAGRQLNILVATAHGVAVGVWIGGLLIGSVFPFERDELAAWHPRFSRVALVALLVVAATGLYQAILYLPAPGALVDSDYGHVLIAKHVFVAGVLAMAGLNRFVAGPALRRTTEIAAAARRASRTIRVEAFIGVAVLAVTGVLATTQTARPGAAIFVRPDVVARLQDPQVQVTGDRGDMRLTVVSVSDTQYRFSVSGTDPALSPPVALTLSGPGDDAARELPLRQDGSGWTATGLAFPRDGVWVASLPLADGSHVKFRLEVSFGRVAAYSDAASRTWEAAVQATETGMRSARMIDELTDGLSVMLFGYHEFVAPDRERFDIQGRFSSVTADGQRYTRDAGSDTWTVRATGAVGTTPPGSSGAGPGSWPWFGFLRGAVGVTVEGDASQAGERCQVLVGIDPQSDVTYEIWVGRDDGMIHRLVMGLPGHYMVNAYFDVNAPIDIEPPDGPVAPAAAALEPRAHRGTPGPWPASTTTRGDAMAKRQRLAFDDPLDPA